MKTIFKRFVRPAFTLIELVITIVVIGILSAALVATYSDLSGSAKKAAGQASVAALQSQIAIHLGAYPIHTFPTMYDLQLEVANLGIASTTTSTGSGATPGYSGAAVTTITSGFKLYSSTGAALTGTNATTNYVFFISTSAGAVVILPFSDSFCTVPVSSADTVSGYTSNTNVGFSIVAYFKNQGTSSISATDFNTFHPSANSTALVQCVRLASFAEMNDTSNATTILSLPYSTH